MITIYLGFLIAFMSASIRVIVFLVFRPPFSNRAFSGRIKAMLRVGLGLACMQRIGPVAQTGFFVVECVIQAFIEFSMALMVRIILAAIQMVGPLLDLEDGLATVQASGPLTMINQATFGRAYELTAMALLFTTNGYQLLIMGSARSFTVMPLGMMFDMSNYVERLACRFTELTVFTPEIAGPLLLMLFLIDMSIGLLTKVVPAMNVFTLGFPLKIMVTAFLAPTIMIVLSQLVVKLVDVAVKFWMGVVL